MEARISVVLKLRVSGAVKAEGQILILYWYARLNSRVRPEEQEYFSLHVSLHKAFPAVSQFLYFYFSVQNKGHLANSPRSRVKIIFKCATHVCIFETLADRQHWMLATNFVLWDQYWNWQTISMVFQKLIESARNVGSRKKNQLHSLTQINVASARNQD